MNSAEIQIKIYDDHIWFWSPGGLPEGITIEDLKKEHASKPRNKLLAMVFYYAGLIERWGTGTKRMMDLCKKQGLPEPEFREEFGGFSVIFWKDIYNEQYLRKIGLNERQIKAILYVKESGRITNREYQKIAGTTDRTALRDLNRLCDLGILQRIGSTGRKTEYILVGQKPDKTDTNTTQTRQRDKADTKGATKRPNEKG